MKPPTIIFTIFLLAALLVPFLSKLHFSEPYPAIILPSGAGQLKKSDGVVHFSYITCEGINSKGNTVSLSLEEIFSPAPPHFISAIISNNLGFPGPSTNPNVQSRFHQIQFLFPWKKIFQLRRRI